MTTKRPREGHDARTAAPRFPLVCIGASAGGLEAFTQLLEALPADTGAAFILVQHLDPTHQSSLTEILSKVTAMPVSEVTDGMRLRPNALYIIPPNVTMLIETGALRLSPRGTSRAPHLPFDLLLGSLTRDRGDDAIGIVLSGNGSDGTLGLSALKAAGGVTFAQDAASARYPGMPDSARASGCIDFVLPPEAIARELARLCHGMAGAEREAAQNIPTLVAADADFTKLLALLRSATGVDFAQYRDTTLKRRILRRMLVHARASLGDYVGLLEENPDEIHALYRDMLINVTSFFRDPAMFETLKREIFPEIVKGASLQSVIRIWVPGCSTGQESYSLAIALNEFLETQPIRPPIQVFGTDISDPATLDKARAGLYPMAIEAEVSPERLERFFTKEDGGYRIAKSIRDSCVFAKQNVANDPPFSRVDLISCRNLLIYLAPPLQKRVIQTFHYALNAGGYLVLGNIETVGGLSDLFDLVDGKHKVFARRSAVGHLPHFAFGNAPLSAVEGNAPRAVSSSDWQREADRILLSRFAPAAILVNDALEILQFRGPIEAYFELPRGDASFNIAKMARDSLSFGLRAAIDQARKQAATVQRGLRVSDEGGLREVDIEVVPVKLPGVRDNCFLVIFTAAAPAVAGRAPIGAAPPARPHDETPPGAGDAVAELKQELAGSKDYLQSVIEQYDASTEELKSANEEILSSNEELQSTNEELQTAKEELQSSNEELTTVNDELHSRNIELNLLNDDMANLLASIEIPIVMVGSDLRIRRFTPAARKVLRLIESDVGRPIGDISPLIDVANLEALIGDVMTSQTFQAQEVRDAEGRCFVLQVRPYMTADKHIDGAVVAFFDIDEIKRAQDRLRETGDYAHAIVETVREPLVILQEDLRVGTANRAYYRMFGGLPEDTEGRLIYELGDGQWNMPGLRNLIENVLPNDSSFDGFEVEQEFPGIGLRIMRLNARRLQNQDGNTRQILLAIEDVTERARAEAAVEAIGRRYQRLFEAALDGILVLNVTTGRIDDANPFMTKLLGYSRDELVGKELWEIGLFKDIAANKSAFEKLQESGYIRYENLPLLTRDARQREVEFISNVYQENGHAVIQCNIRDITERRRVEIELAQHRDRLEESVAERTADLEETHHRLRASERLLALGTLSSGLGHDLANLLFPVRVRLDDMDTNALSDALRENVESIRQSVGYLQGLANGLRLMALDPDEIAATSPSTELDSWWGDAEAMFRNALPRGITLEHRFAEPGLRVGVPPHRLTQAIFNLVQNAGDAMHGVTAGRVTIRAHTGSKGVIRLDIEDNGLGMTEEVKRRCVEPFFTTKPRAISTGLGLMLVHGIVQTSGGTIEIDSVLERGTRITLSLPAGTGPAEPPAAQPVERGRALVTLGDPRVRSYVTSILQSFGFELLPLDHRAALDADLWVSERDARFVEGSQDFVAADARRRIVLFGTQDADLASPQIIDLGASPKPAAIRAALRDAATPRS